MIELATGIALRDGCLLLVASRYVNHPQPLWTLPGGRRQPGELLVETLEREVFEETGLRAQAGELAYLGESYDGSRGYLNATFTLLLPGSELAPVAPLDRKDHTIAAAWVPIAEVPQRMAVAVVREPLLAYLRGALPRRYAGFHDAGVTIEWPPDSV